MQSVPNNSHKQRHVLYLLATSAVILAAVGSLVVSFINAERSSFLPDAEIDLDATKPTGSSRGFIKDGDAEALRVAIAPVISPEKSLEIYRDFVEYLGRKLDRSTVYLTGQDYSEVNNMVRHNQCDIAFVCTYSFILGERDYGMKLLAIPEVNGKHVYHSYIITRKASTCSTLLDFRNKRFASSDVLSTSGWLYPMAWLKSQGMDLELFFEKQIITGSHDRSVYAVKSGIVDGAAVDSLVYEELLQKEPSLKNELKVIQKSDSFGMPPLVVPKQLSADLTAELRAVLFDMHKDSDGRKILEALSIDRFVTAETESYESVRLLRDNWEKSP